MDFSGKVIIVTGASSGIGAATALTLSQRGATVVLVGRNVKNLHATEAACKASNKNATCLTLVADVNTDGEQIIAKTIEQFGRIDVLVNNAGIFAYGSIEDTDVQQFDSMMNTNMRAVFVLTQLATPHLIRSEGCIVNVSSVGGTRSFANALSYCVSKAALDQFTKCVALELAAKNVRVNSVNPGVIVTAIQTRNGMSEADYAQYLEKSKETHAMGRVGEAREVAESIAFLASSAASFITGATLPIDGGKHAMCPR